MNSTSWLDEGDAWVAAGAPPLYAPERDLVEWGRRLRLAAADGEQFSAEFGMRLARASEPARRAAIARIDERGRHAPPARELAVLADPEYLAACRAASETFGAAHPVDHR